MFQLMIVYGISRVFELILAALADSIDHVVETVDDVKGINTDFCVGEYVFSQGRKAAAHIAAEVFDLFAFFQGKARKYFWRQVPEIWSRMSMTAWESPSEMLQ